MFLMSQHRFKLICAALVMLSVVVAAGAGWWAGRSKDRARRVRRLGRDMLLTIAAAVATIPLAEVFLSWRGGPQTTPFTGDLVFLAPAMMTLAAVAMIVACCAATLTECWVERRLGRFTTLALTSGLPLAIAPTLFAANLIRTSSSGWVAFGTILVCVLVALILASYALSRAERTEPFEVVVNAGHEGELL